MRYKLFNLKPGAVIMIMGMGGLVFALASKMRMIERIAISIVCLVLIVIGALIENPGYTLLSADPVEEMDFE